MVEKPVRIVPKRFCSVLSHRQATAKKNPLKQGRLEQKENMFSCSCFKPAHLVQPTELPNNLSEVDKMVKR